MVSKAKEREVDHRKDGIMTLEKQQIRRGTDQNGKGWRRPSDLHKNKQTTNTLVTYTKTKI